MWHGKGREKKIPLFSSLCRSDSRSCYAYTLDVSASVVLCEWGRPRHGAGDGRVEGGGGMLNVGVGGGDEDGWDGVFGGGAG